MIRERVLLEVRDLALADMDFGASVLRLGAASCLVGGPEVVRGRPGRQSQTGYESAPAEQDAGKHCWCDTPMPR